jgi:hypothetical protein
MRKIADYRQHAEECRCLAKSATAEHQRKQFLAMAATWDTLADDRQELMRRYPELFPAMGSQIAPNARESRKIALP